jgi:hypothetical protein
MKKTRKDFERYHSENTKVYQLFCYFADKVRKAGFKKYSAEAIFNQIRWYTDVETQDAEGFKINNDYKPYYSRKYMEEHNCDLFYTRKSIADN